MGGKDLSRARLDAKRVSQVQISTPALRERLNRIYSQLAPGRRSGGNSEFDTETGHFDVLWDLKELAMVEGRQSVEIPASWLEDLERACQADEKGCQGN